MSTVDSYSVHFVTVASVGANSDSLQQRQALLPNRKRKKVKLYNIIY